MATDVASDIVDKVIDELDGRSVFNGIDEDVMEEIRESLYDIVVKEIL